MSLEQLFKDYNIQFTTEGKNTMSGWINVQCPFCDDTSNHMGINADGWGVHCWRCGKHRITETLERLLKVRKNEVIDIIKKYKSHVPKSIKDTIQSTNIKPYKRPYGVEDLLPNHIKYLTKRNYNIDYLTNTWEIKGTGPLAHLDNIDYNHRLFIPIIWENQEVSFQTRDITNKSDLRYKACPKDREIIHHKDILYMHPDIILYNKKAICVEGVTDVWRLGKLAFATFGIEYTRRQVRQIAKHFNKIYLLFDSEPQAQYKAKQLKSELEFLNVYVENLNCRVFGSADPGGLRQEEANKIVGYCINTPELV